MNIKPLGERLVVKPIIAEQKTAGGIVLPDSAKEKPQQGEVLAVGSGKILDNGNRLAMEVAVGDKVLYSKYAGTEIKINEEDVLILSERDILAIL